MCEIARVGAAELQATSMATLCQMVAAGQGVTLLPASAASIEARRETGVIVRRLAGAEPFRTIGMAWRPSAPWAPHFDELAEGIAPAIEQVIDRGRRRAA